MVFAAKYIQQGIVSPKHFHYVAPSFWAWKGGEARIKGLSEFVDHVLCILPFEAEACKLNGIAATFVGHPTLEDILEFKVIPFWRSIWFDISTDIPFKETTFISSHRFYFF